MPSATPNLSTPWGAVTPAPAETETADRILDAALALFRSQGIAATTMSAIAAEAGLSRVWLYRHFENHDAVVRALLARELRAFIAGVAERGADLGPREALIERLDHALGFLIELDLLERVLESDPDAVVPMLTGQSGSLLRLGVEAVRRDVQALSGQGPARARLIGETLVRVALSVLVTGPVVVDFDDPKARRAYLTFLVDTLVCR